MMGAPLAFVMMIVMIIFLISIGVIVYKDAKALGLNAVLWTVVAVFVPNFVGIIIYLVVRSTTPKKAICSSCKTPVKDEYNICPECGSKFVKFCNSCKQPVEAGLKICPYCGESVEGVEEPTGVKIYPKTNFGKSIGIMAAIALGIALIGIVGSIVFRKRIPRFPGPVPRNVSMMESESNGGNKYKDKFKYKDGDSRLTFKANGKGENILSGEIKVHEGSITMEIVDETGDAIYNQEFVAAENPYTIQLSLGTEEAKYRANVHYSNARGSIAMNVIQP